MKKRIADPEPLELEVGTRVGFKGSKRVGKIVKTYRSMHRVEWANGDGGWYAESVLTKKKEQ